LREASNTGGATNLLIRVTAENLFYEAFCLKSDTLDSAVSTADIREKEPRMEGACLNVHIASTEFLVPKKPNGAVQGQCRFCLGLDDYRRRAMAFGQHYSWMHDMMGWGMWMIPWGWILVVVLVVILIYALAGRAGQRPPEPPVGSRREEKRDLDTPLEIVKKRYARGEISREDFEQMKKDLSS